VNAVLLRPLPFKEPDRLVKIWENQPEMVQGTASIPNLKDWREQNDVFTGIAALIDPATYKVLARLPSGVNPHDIAVSTDGRYAYIAVMGTQQEPGHSVTVLDLRLRVVKTTIELNPYNRRHDLKVSRNGARLWATCAPSKAVIEIDTRSGRVIRDWKLDTPKSGNSRSLT
jgi:DNA-binding beta-propeller fold protein YncE